jgi:sulfate adenylyltransferase
MDRETYESVVEDMRLPNGLVWTLPVTLPVDEGGPGSYGRTRR